MTLLYTEISQDLPGHGRCVLFAADRRITTPRHYKKLVDIPYLNAALGFFGLAEFRRSQTVFRMSDHLREFVRAQAGTTSLALFAERLARSLNSFVPSSLRRSERSGIHISGMTGDSLPEFWFVRNVDDTGQPTLGKYEADEQYLSRDARNDGFDGKDAATLPPHGRLYRNGDILSHAVAWEAIDETLGKLRNVSLFSPIQTPSDYARGSVSRWRCCSTSKSDLQRSSLLADRSMSSLSRVTSITYEAPGCQEHKPPLTKKKFALVTTSLSEVTAL